MELDHDVLVCNLRSLMLMGRNCDDWVRKFNPLMCIEMGITEGLFNMNTCKRNQISKVMRVILLFTRSSALPSGVYIFL